MDSGAAIPTSVVVSTYDDKRWSDLVACLESLTGQTAPPLEIIVVVDHNASLLERVAESFPEVKAIANSRPRGLAGARNTGTSVAAGEIVAFIDDDARAEAQWLARIEESFAAPSVVGVGGALIPRWEDGAREWVPPEFLWVFGCSYVGLPETAAPVRNPIGANMAVRIAALREIGGFREGDSSDAPKEIRSRGVVRAAGNIPDDTDLAIRVRRRYPEAIWLYQPQARVHHTVTSERATWGYFIRRCFEEGVGKANLSRYVGAEDGLSSERRYATTVLPLGVLRNLRALIRGDLQGAARATAILAGLAATGLGFLAATLRSRARGPNGTGP